MNEGLRVSMNGNMKMSANVLKSKASDLLMAGRGKIAYDISVRYLTVQQTGPTREVPYGSKVAKADVAVAGYDRETGKQLWRSSGSGSSQVNFADLSEPDEKLYLDAFADAITKSLRNN